ncbi:MAG: hypothetical protein NTW19_23665 [Planctomycetota bacterium]|nr:hypothetical protein [Planctomycetota bacterium]
MAPSTKRNFIIGSAIAALALGGFLIVRTVSPPTGGRDPWTPAWCYDLATGKPFVGSEKDVPPFKPAGSPADAEATGVRVEMYACGSCADAAKAFPAWVWKFSPELHSQVAGVIAANPKGPPDMSPYNELDRFGVKDGILIAGLDQIDKWYPENSDDGRDIKGVLKTQCPKGDAVRCPAK